MRKERPHGWNQYGISHRSVLTNDMENRPWPFLPWGPNRSSKLKPESEVCFASFFAMRVKAAQKGLAFPITESTANSRPYLKRVTNYCSWQVHPYTGEQTAYLGGFGPIGWGQILTSAVGPIPLACIPPGQMKVLIFVLLYLLLIRRSPSWPERNILSIKGAPQQQELVWTLLPSVDEPSWFIPFLPSFMHFFRKELWDFLPKEIMWTNN